MRVGRFICAEMPPPRMNCCRRAPDQGAESGASPAGSSPGASTSYSSSDSVSGLSIPNASSTTSAASSGTRSAAGVRAAGAYRARRFPLRRGDLVGASARSAGKSSPDSRMVPSAAGWPTPSGSGRLHATTAVVVIVAVAVGVCAGCCGGRAARRALACSPRRALACSPTGAAWSSALVVGDPSRFLVVRRSCAGVAIGRYRAGGVSSGAAFTALISTHTIAGE